MNDKDTGSELIEQLVSTVERTTSLLRLMVEHHESRGGELGLFREDLKLIRDKVSHIVKVLHEGNGEKPLVTRVAVIETKMENVEADIESIRKTIEASEERTENKRGEVKRMRWDLVIALIAAAATIAAATITLLN